MKTLKLSETFKTKLDKASSPVSTLSYIGADADSYAGSTFVAIVGTRKPSPYGIMMTKQYAETLSRSGVVIVSGLAFGVDSIAHQAALDAGGRNISILPSGLGTIYPASHAKLAEKIVANNGTLISEYQADHTPFKVSFLERNRIIAALSDVVIIPEAAEGSGSLNTAMHARKSGVQVFVLPGNANNPMSKGTNQLLVNHLACATTDPTDILKFLQIGQQEKQLALDLSGETPQETIILQKIAVGFNDPHDLQQETQLDTTEFQTSMTMLEIAGRIQSDSTGRWHLT